MLSRFFMPAALLAACVVAVAAAPVRADAKKTDLQRKTYPVADLLIAAASETDTVKTEQPGKPIQAFEDKLIKLITNTIEPSSWLDAGGPGTIDYFPLAGVLVVNQTQDVHEMIGDILTALRRLAEQEVSLEVRIVTLCDDGCERIGVDFNNPNGGSLLAGIKAIDASYPWTGLTMFLSETQVKSFLEAAQSDSNTTNIMQSPKLTLRSGQTGNLCIGCPDGKCGENAPTPTNCYAPDPTAQTESPAACFRMSAQPVVSADGRFVKVALDIDQPGKVTLHSTVVLPDDGTAVFGGFQKVIAVQKERRHPVMSRIPYLNRCFTTLGYVSETQQTFVLVTPRILALHEEERPTGFTITPCLPGSNLGPDDHNAEPKQGSTMVPTMWALVTRYWGEIYQTYIPSAGMTLPQPHYLEHLPQYTPPSQLYLEQTPQVPSPNCTTSPQTPRAALAPPPAPIRVPSLNCTTSLQTIQNTQPQLVQVPQNTSGYDPQMARSSWSGSAPVQAPQAPSGYVPSGYLAATATSAAQPMPCATEDGAKRRQSSVLAELLKAYDEACAAGRTSEATKYAKAALLIDPTCFHKK